MRYGERTAMGIAEGKATMLEERRRVKSAKRIMVGRNEMGKVSFVRPPATPASGRKTIRGGDDYLQSGAGGC